MRYCPKCRQELFRVFFGDELMWWRCMDCRRVFAFQEYAYEDGDLVRIAEWRDEDETGRRKEFLRETQWSINLRRLPAEAVKQLVAMG